MAEETKSAPRIVVAFQDYIPPFDAEKTILRMLLTVPPKYLWGLHAIVITNVRSLSRKERDQRTRGRDRRIALGQALGYYTQAWKGEPARITLLLDNLEKQWGRSWLRFGFTRDTILSDLLFHELGHHIHRLHIPEYEGRENVADKWSKKLRGKFLRHQYWYVMPLIYPFVWITRLGKKIAKQFPRTQAKS
jgi:hypothetical protein